MAPWLVRSAAALVAASLISLPSTVAGSGKGEGSGTIESRVREVNTLHRYVYLEDGTMLLANDPRQLDQVAPGARVRAAFEERAGRKFITRLEILQ